MTTEDKERIKQRDGNRCIKCGDIENLTIDHIKPQSIGGSDDDFNLQTLCFSCNNIKADTHFSLWGLVSKKIVLSLLEKDIKRELRTRLAGYSQKVITIVDSKLSAFHQSVRDKFKLQERDLFSQVARINALQSENDKLKTLQTIWEERMSQQEAELNRLHIRINLLEAYHKLTLGLPKGKVGYVKIKTK